MGLDPKVRRAHVALSRAIEAESSQNSSPYTHPIDTAIAPSGPDRTTPRAQTRQDYDEQSSRKHRMSLSGSSLAGTSAIDQESETVLTSADIAESEDHGPSENSSAVDSSPSQSSHWTSASQVGQGSPGTQTMGEALHGINESEREVANLKTALNECWTLCNTLARLSQNHRQRMFKFSGGKADIEEHAWRTCWRLCQNLYESRDEDHATQIRPTLELCRDFCQALFDVRHRGDEASDSVLRVSFELNNHLYNAHDRSLPEAFRERTLDFYLTLCHRLMKQRTSLPEETDALLHACWSLAEMLFSIRQNSRDGKAADEELLGSAIQACWELCDLFREGWTQVRPERGTPRPAQFAFAAAAVPAPPSVAHSQISQVSRSERSRATSSLNGSYHSASSG